MYKKTAEDFCKALKLLATNEDNLSNFQSYLENHFDTWLTKYANTPECITHELKAFAEME